MLVPRVKIRIGPEICEKTMKFPVGSSVLVRPGLGFGLEFAFYSVRLALECLAFAWFASGGPACGVGVLM